MKRVARKCLLKWHTDKAGAGGLEECQLAHKAFGYLIQEGQAGAQAYIEGFIIIIVLFIWGGGYIYIFENIGVNQNFF